MSTDKLTVRDLITFTRFTVIGFTWTLPLLGGLIGTQGVASPLLLFLLLLATCYHTYGYVLNDIIDLELDRLVPRRATKPLIRGAISVKTALWVALLQVPLMIALTFLMEGNRLSHLLLLGSILSMALYNGFGKKIKPALLTDLIQGIACALLVLYGHALTGTPLAPLTYWVAGFVVIYIMLINGIHGSLRDLPTDALYGARSTALELGATFIAPDKIHLPLPLRSYTLLLQGALVGLAWGAARAGNAATGANASSLVLALWTLLTCGLLIFLFTQEKITKLAAVGTLQAIAAYWSIKFALLDTIGLAGVGSLLGVYLAPMLVSDWLLPSFSGKLDLKTIPTTNKQ